jgi:hypothetical protein
MATFVKRGKNLFRKEEGKPLRRTDETPPEGERVTDGRNVYQMQNGELALIQKCNDNSHPLRSRGTLEGGGRLI